MPSWITHPRAPGRPSPQHPGSFSSGAVLRPSTSYSPRATLIGGCCSLSHNIGPAPFSVKRRSGANPYNLKDSPCRRRWLHACPPSSDPTESNRERTHRNWLVHFAGDLSVSEPTVGSGLVLLIGSYNRAAQGRVLDGGPEVGPNQSITVGPNESIKIKAATS